MAPVAPATKTFTAPPNFAHSIARPVVESSSIGKLARNGLCAGELGRLLASRDIVLEEDDAVRAALHTFIRRNIDFADALIGEVNRLRGCEVTATFDRKAAKLEGFVHVV